MLSAFQNAFVFSLGGLQKHICKAEVKQFEKINSRKIVREVVTARPPWADRKSAGGEVLRGREREGETERDSLSHFPCSKLFPALLIEAHPSAAWQQQVIRFLKRSLNFVE